MKITKRKQDQQMAAISETVLADCQQAAHAVAAAIRVNPGESECGHTGKADRQVRPTSDSCRGLSNMKITKRTQNGKWEHIVNQCHPNFGGDFLGKTNPNFRRRRNYLYYKHQPAAPGRETAAARTRGRWPLKQDRTSNPRILAKNQMRTSLCSHSWRQIFCNILPVLLLKWAWTQ